MSTSFLQSKEWAQFQESFGRKIFWVNSKLVVKFDLPFNKSWLYSARPDFKDKKDLDLFASELLELAKKENTIFAKIEPNIDSNDGHSGYDRNLSKNSDSGQVPKYRGSSILIGARMTPPLHLSTCDFRLTACLQPQDELVLDISRSEEELLSNMHQKTRYNIRLAQKNDLKIEISHNPEDVEKFYELALKTSARDGFKYHEKNYYKKMIEILGKSKDVRVELLIIEASVKKQVSSIENTKYQLPDTSFVPIASSILLYHDKTCYYLHGASDHEYRSLMAPYLMQWQAILRAKELGYKWYNFGGVTPCISKEFPIINSQFSNNLKISNLNIPKLEIGNWKLEIPKNHPWSGITRFKTGFAPPGVGVNQILHYPEAYDIIFQRGWHIIYKLLKRFK